MLAPRRLPASYNSWNHVNGAPFGRALTISPLKLKSMSPEAVQRLRGPFAFQGNNTIRQFEYPWAFDVAAITPGMSLVELGAGLSGLQFVLDAFGCHVINIDPGMEAMEWPCSHESIEKLNDLFGTHVELINMTIENASLKTESIDRVFSISVLEHLSPTMAAGTMREIHRCLKPNGLFILTTDLFLNVQPFCSRLSNEYGQNQDLRSLIDDTMWEIAVGDRIVLCGFPEFDTDFILSHLEDYLIGTYPALAQCLVLKRL